MSITISVTVDQTVTDDSTLIANAKTAVAELAATPSVTVTAATLTDTSGVVTNLLPEVDTPLEVAVDDLAASINVLSANPDGTYTVSADQFAAIVKAANEVETAAVVVPDVDPASAAPPTPAQAAVGAEAVFSAAAAAADATKATDASGGAVAI